VECGDYVGSETRPQPREPVLVLVVGLEDLKVVLDRVTERDVTEVMQQGAEPRDDGYTRDVPVKGATVVLSVPLLEEVRDAVSAEPLL